MKDFENNHNYLDSLIEYGFFEQSQNIRTIFNRFGPDALMI